MLPIASRTDEPDKGNFGQDHFAHTRKGGSPYKEVQFNKSEV